VPLATDNDLMATVNFALMHGTKVSLHIDLCSQSGVLRCILNNTKLCVLVTELNSFCGIQPFTLRIEESTGTQQETSINLLHLQILKQQLIWMDGHSGIHFWWLVESLPSQLVWSWYSSILRLKIQNLFFVSVLVGALLEPCASFQSCISTVSTVCLSILGWR